MNRTYTLIALSLLFLSACKSASKAFDHGDYSQAIEIAVKKLQKNPDDAEVQYILQNAYRHAVARHEERIRNLSQGTSDTRWEQMYYEYALMQRLYDNIHESPAAAGTTRPVSYAAELRTTGDKAAEFYYNRGQALLNEGTDRLAFRDAYAAFRNALRFRPHDAELTNKLREAREAATIYVWIAPINRHGSYMYSNAYQVSNFQNDVARSVRHGVNNDFVAFLSGADNYSNIQPDEIVEMRLGTISIGRPYEESVTREVSKEVVVKETVYSKDSIVKQMGKVYARITTTRRTLTSRADLFLNITDRRQRTLLNDMLQSQDHWTTEFATYTGDERALSEADKALLNRSPRRMPSENAIIEQLLQELQSEVTQRLRHHYNRY